MKLIHQLRKENDSMVKEKSEIIDEIYNFYQNLFKSQSIDNEKIDDYLSNFKSPNLTKEDQEAMDRFISEEEVKGAIKNLNINKSPGDDEITPEFYQTFSHTLAPILAEVYNNIWLRDEMTISMRNGIIQLIYKKKSTPTELKFWRPITLLNLDYKILTKILAGRLKCAMDYLLKPNQSSGVKERDILDNILNLKNLIEYTKAKNLQAAFISLDNEKAFDRIEINYMLKVLEKYKFSEYYLRWIKIIYNDITSQVMVNGKLTEKNDIKRSVRQGCPMSMLLYVLCLEPLIDRINKNPQIKGIKIPNCYEEIKTIQHADDMTVMIASDMSYVALEQENNLFSKVSGSKINMEKTEVLKYGNFEAIPKIYIKETIKVLGCYFGKNETQNFHNAFTKMDKIIKNWKFLKLNTLEKILMLKTYVISILQFPLRAFLIPRGYDKKINGILYPFIWNSKREKIARDIINQTYENGGLAMIDITRRSIANILQNVANIEQKLNQPWALLYIYWFGLILKNDFPNLAKNNWAHTMDLPININFIKCIINRYNKDKQI